MRPNSVCQLLGTNAISARKRRSRLPYPWHFGKRHSQRAVPWGRMPRTAQAFVRVAPPSVGAPRRPFRAVTHTPPSGDSLGSSSCGVCVSWAGTVPFDESSRGSPAAHMIYSVSTCLTSMDDVSRPVCMRKITKILPNNVSYVLRGG
jgi:hypothetical protein